MHQIVKVVGAAIVRDGRCLIAQRGPSMSAPGKWEFPGGKVESGEDASTALRREIEEELGVVIVVGEHLGRGQARSPRRVIVLDVYAAELVGGEPFAHEHGALAWVESDELDAFDWAEPDIPIAPRVAAWLRRGAGASPSSGRALESRTRPPAS